MNLSEFIHETLRDISIGITKAKLEVSDLTAIAPGSLRGEIRTTETEVTFDVAVSASSENSSKGTGGASAGASLKVLSVDVSVGADGTKEKSSSSENSNVSRISFSVPILLNAMSQNPSEAAKAEKEYLKRRVGELEKDK